MKLIILTSRILYAAESVHLLIDKITQNILHLKRKLLNVKTQKYWGIEKYISVFRKPGLVGGLGAEHEKLLSNWKRQPSRKFESRESSSKTLYQEAYIMQ